jgi:hypothetical protein
MAAAAEEALGKEHHPEARVIIEVLRDQTRRRIAIVAAVIIVLIVIVVGVTQYAGSGNHGGGNNEPRIPTPLHKPLPGTVVVGDYSGTGPATLHPQSHQVPSGHDLFLHIRCVGAGPVTVGPKHMSTCHTPVAQLVTGVPLDPLSVDAPKDTQWRIVLSDQPQLETNGVIENPADAALADPHAAGTLAYRAGRGPARITIRRPAGRKKPYAVRIALSCRGAGVSIGSNVAALNGKYTHSCFAGWSYDFDVAKTSLPATLIVTAAKTTTWRLAVVSA